MVKESREREEIRRVVDVSRKIVRSIWRKAREGARLSEQERRIAEMLRLHGQFAGAWETEEVPGKDIGNDSFPFLHIHVHLLVERQMREGSPPEVREAAQALEAKGVGRHEIAHILGSAFLDAFAASVREGRPFDGEAYAARLKTLSGRRELQKTNGTEKEGERNEQTSELR